MSKILCVVAVFIAVCCAGCLAPTQTTVREYDADGKISKETVTSESVVSSLVESTQNKTIVLWESGWAAYMSASTATMENPTPTVKMFAGKTDRGLISALKGQKFDGMAEVIHATKYDFSVSADGIANGNAEKKE